MNAYHLAALPPTLLLIADPALWPWVLAVAGVVAFIVAVMLWLDGKALRREVASLRFQLTEARLTDPTTATTQRVPWLRVVRETDDDYWAGIMRASDELR